MMMHHGGRPSTVRAFAVLRCIAQVIVFTAWSITELFNGTPSCNT
jgi:hypothetical protein